MHYKDFLTGYSYVCLYMTYINKQVHQQEELFGFFKQLPAATENNTQESADTTLKL